MITFISIISVIILIFSVIVHEVCHGLMAERLGDPTARLQGRLTLNPVKHIDPVGSILVPIITSMYGFTFGWAKPVPYNPYNLRNKRQAEVLIALAGPFSNLLLAIIFGLIIRFSTHFNLVNGPFLEVATYIVLINLVLAIFNLIPLPPLDGSKLFLAFLPTQYGRLRYTLEAFGPVFILIVVFMLWQVVSPVIPHVFRFITGLPI